jgi:hypothetical protein
MNLRSALDAGLAGRQELQSVTLCTCYNGEGGQDD